MAVHTAKARNCHSNVMAFVRAHPDHRIARGYLLFDFLGVLPFVRLVAHSVVKTPAGHFIDITPGPHAGRDQFIPHIGDNATFEWIAEAGSLDVALTSSDEEAEAILANVGGWFQRALENDGGDAAATVATNPGDGAPPLLTYSEYREHSRRLLGRISELETTQPLLVQDGWEPEYYQCHRNVHRWVQEHPEARHVLGFSVYDFRADLGFVRFLAHSVIEKPRGTLLEITPTRSGVPRPFLRYLGPIEDFVRITRSTFLDAVVGREAMNDYYAGKDCLSDGVLRFCAKLPGSSELGPTKLASMASMRAALLDIAADSVLDKSGNYRNG